MAEAALVEEMQVPKGGIADFVMSDEDIEAVYGPDDDGAEEYGTEGLGQFTEVANQMAAKGRYGDDMVAHVESGELVIPKEFLDRDPELKRSLFKYLEDHGIENPERYVVGSDANSLNPDTGMPEFFFKKVKKAFKKVAKTVSKVAKPVIKIIQKAAPIVLPIALSMTPLGPVFGAALGSGIASLINGGSIKDAFKSALISGAMGAAGAGVSGMMSGQGFMAGVGQAVSNPMARLGQTFTGAQNSLTRLVGGEVAANAPGFFSDFVQPATQAASSIGDVSQQVAQTAGEPLNTTQALKSATSATNLPQPLDPSFSSDFAPSAYKFEQPFVGMPSGNQPIELSKLAADSGITPASYSPTQDPQAFANAQFDAGNKAFSMDLGTGEILYNGQPIPSSLSTTQTAVPTQDIGDFMSGPVFKTGYTQPNLDMTVPRQDIGDFMVGQKTQPSFLDTVQDYGQQAVDFFGGKSSLTPQQSAEISANASKDYLDAYNKVHNKSFTIADAPPDLRAAAMAAGKSAVAAAQPGLLAKYGPMAALGAGTFALTEATGLTDFTKTPPQESPGLITETGEQRVRERPEEYMVADLGYQRFNPETGQYETVQNPYPNLDSYVSPTQYTYNLAPRTRPAGGPFSRPGEGYTLPPNIMYQTAADGGPIFPRRNGGIMPDEGVPGKDSVRAMLMPGEFVMTTDAVRGAGGGNLNRGINNMYTVMRNLESRGRRIA